MIRNTTSALKKLQETIICNVMIQTKLDEHNEYAPTD